MISKVISTAAAKGIGIGDVIGGGFNAYGAYQDYKSSRENDGSIPVSVAKAGATMLVGEILGGYAIPYFMTTAAVKGLVQMGDMTSKSMNQAYKNKGYLGSGHVSMSNAGYTMRQRSMSAIQQNASNVNSLFGNEARTYFRNSGY